MKRLLLIDDHEVVRDGVKRIFDGEPEDFVFGDAANPAEAIRLAETEEWDAALLDLTLSERSGLEVLKELKRRSPRLPVAILSMHADPHYARRALETGASGYITKDTHRDELARAIRKIIGGGRYVSPPIADQLIATLGQSSDRPLHEALSNREFEVMRLIASGKTVGEIADLLYLSDKTISTYRARILEKLGLKTNAAMTHYAIQNNLV